MATDIFKLLGTISVETKDFNTAIDNALTKVNNLAAAINGLNGMTANVNVNTSGSVPSAPYVGTNTNTSGSAGSDSSDKDSKETGSKLSPAVTLGGSKGGEGWTIGKGIVTNLGTDALRWVGREAKELWDAGWMRNVEEEKMTATFATLMKTTPEDAAVTMKELNRFALDTPLDAPDTWTVARRLLSSGVAPDELSETMQWMGDITMGNSDVMLGFAKAYTESLGKGKLFAQEGYQFINAGIPVYNILEDYYASDEYEGMYKGLTAGEIMANLNTGKEPVIISGEDLTAAFKYATSERGQYHNAMANMMNSSFGQEQKIAENNEIIAATVTKPFVQFAKDVVNPFVLDIQESLIRNFEYMEEMKEANDILYDGDPFGAAKTGTPLWNSVVELFKHRPVEEEEEREPVIYGDEYGAGGLVDAITFDPENYVPGNMGMQSLIVQLQNLPQQVSAAVQEGMNGVTITANVTTGDVRLQDGALVGALTPKINLMLGALNTRSGRG